MYSSFVLRKFKELSWVNGFKIVYRENITKVVSLINDGMFPLNHSLFNNHLNRILDFQNQPQAPD